MSAQSSVVKINAISVPPQAGPELEKRFAARAHTVDGADGFLGFQLLRPVAGDDRYFVVTHWRDEEAFAAWRDGDARAAHAGRQRRGPAGVRGRAGRQAHRLSSRAPRVSARPAAG